MEFILVVLIGLTVGFPIVLRIFLVFYHRRVRRKMWATYDYDEITIMGEAVKVPRPIPFGAPVKKAEALEMTCHMIEESIKVYFKNFFRLVIFVKHPVMLFRAQIDNFTGIIAALYLLFKISLSPQREYAKMPMPPSISSLSAKYYPWNKSK